MATGNTSMDNAALASKSPQELTSILSQVQSLQSDRERLVKELEEARSKMDKLQVVVASIDSRNHTTIIIALCLFSLVALVFAIIYAYAYFDWRRREKGRR